jgi:hypothetical protein
MTPLLDRLRAACEALPPGSSITFSVEELKVQLDGEHGVRAPSSKLSFVAPGDTLTLPQLAARYSRSASTMRALVAAGAFPGAFRIAGRGAWRIPITGCVEFERESAARTRAQPAVLTLKGAQSIGDWRKVRRARRGPA